MDESLKTLTGLLGFVHQEINRIRSAKEVPENSREELRKSSILTIDLQRSLDLARAWSISESRK
jgi:hypothetical protein